MKTTLDIPDAVFRSAKAKAAEEGVPLRQFVTDALTDKLEKPPTTQAKEIIKLVGGLRRLRKENAQIRMIIEHEFERIDPEEWA
jgi:hypothetical protein